MTKRVLLMLVLASCGSTQTATSSPKPSDPQQTSQTTDPRRVFPADWEEELAKDPNWPANAVYLQIRLARLGYFKRPFIGEMDNRTIDAFAEYKRDVGLPPGDAIIDAKLMERMDEDMDGLIQPAGVMPYHFRDFRDDIFIQGTWTGVGSAIASPQQMSEIKCSKDLGICFEAMAKLTDDHGLLSAQALIHTVDVWNDREVIAVGDRAQCAYWTTKLNRVTKKVSRSRTITDTEGLCETVTENDFHLRLADGREIHEQLVREYIDRERTILGLPGDAH